MQTKKLLSIAIALLITGVMVSGLVSAQDGSTQLKLSNPQDTSSVVGPPTSLKIGGLLYNQTDSASGNGAPFQDFEASFDAYDNEAADDFVVPAPGWAVDGIMFVSTAGTATVPNSVVVTIYDDGGGLPGAVACSPTTNVINASPATLTVEFDAPCNLLPGTYWAGAYVVGDFATFGQFFWSNRSVATGNKAAWRNPGDGFGSGCTNWAVAGDTCGVGGGSGQMEDFLFALYGELYNPVVPVAGINVPNKGEIMITVAMAQPVYDSPGGSIARHRGGQEVWAPHDWDHNGFDTYVITETVEVDGRTWYGIFFGNEQWVYVPADKVIVTR